MAEEEDDYSSEEEEIEDETGIPTDEVSAFTVKSLKKKLMYATNKADYLKAVLLRRTAVIDDLRASYLKDVVTMKLIMNNVLKGTERESVMHQYNAYLPSVDLRAALQLHSPQQAHMLVKPCESCGGQLDILISDGNRVAALRKTLDEVRQREDQLRVANASLEYKLELRKEEIIRSDQTHTDEVCLKKCKFSYSLLLIFV